jgi:hypothetical protein
MTTKKTTEFIFLFLLVFTFSLSLFSASPFGYDIDDTPGTYTYNVNQTINNYGTINGSVNMLGEAIYNSGNITPKTDTFFSIGNPSLRWLDGWFVNMFLNVLNVTGKSYFNGNVSIHDNGNPGNLFMSGGTIRNVTSINPLGSYLNLGGTINITGDLIVEGNMSIKRPYGMFSDNTTQIINLVNTPQVVNFSTVEDSYLMNLVNKQNFSFQLSGDYLIEVSAIYTVDTNGEYIQFWVQKTNSSGQFVNIPRSNTRMQFPNAYTEIPLAVPFIIDLLPTDKLRFMTATSNAGSSIVYTTNTSYSPATPSIIVTFSKISEITP